MQNVNENMADRTTASRLGSRCRSLFLRPRQTYPPIGTDFRTLIEINRRNSWFIVLVFTVFVGFLGLVIGYAMGVQAGGRDAGPVFALGALGVAGLMSLVGAGASYYAGASAILRMSGARRLERSEDPQLHNVVEEMAIAAGLPVPAVYIINDTAPNAFATGRDPAHAAVAITTGLRSKLTRDELQGVIAHELSHIRNYDTRFAVLMATLVGMVLLLCDFFLRSLGWGRWSGRRSSRRSGKGGALPIIVFALVLSLAAPALAKIIEMAFSRQREYLADASAVDLTRNPSGLASALAKISADPDVLEVANRATAPLYIVHPIKRFEDRASSIMDSHPPIKDRISRLLAMG